MKELRKLSQIAYANDVAIAISSMFTSTIASLIQGALSSKEPRFSSSGLQTKKKPLSSIRLDPR